MDMKIMITESDLRTVNNHLLKPWKQAQRAAILRYCERMHKISDMDPRTRKASHFSHFFPGAPTDLTFCWYLR